ncbi:MAG: phosphatidate cytidylyltransferase [Pseudomonadota bacterium]
MLRQRILTAVIAVVLLLAVLYAAPPVLARTVIAGLFVAAAWEWSGFLGATPTVRWVFVGLIAALEGAVWLWLPDPGAYQLLASIAVVWWIIALVWLFLFPTPIAKPVVWLCGAVVLIPTYVALDWLYLQSPHYLLALLVVVWSADVGAYFAGRSFGRVKLAPMVSPGKTWEGVFGGVVVVLAVVTAVALWQDLALAVVLPFCAAVAMLSVVGDLTVSMFKRHSGVKDSGRLFPGHGGILDRIDSVCAAAPLFAGGVALYGAMS